MEYTDGIIRLTILFALGGILAPLVIIWIKRASMQVLGVLFFVGLLIAGSESDVLWPWNVVLGAVLFISSGLIIIFQNR